MNTTDKFKVREGIDQDKNFIFSTWLNGLYYGNDWFKEIPNAIFYKNYQKVIETILTRPDIEVKVACLSDMDDVILGYIIYESDKIHWIFVKDSWRKMGIARSMFPTNIKTCTHLTKIGKSLKYKLDISFNPFI